MKTHLISAQLLQELSLRDFEKLKDTFGYGVLSEKIKYEVSIFKIIYKTNFVERTIHASGLLFIPNNCQTLSPFLSIQNGTTFLKNEAPTELIKQAYTGFEFFAFRGYITLVPDYIGYGESRQHFHPYYDQKHSASCVIDMIQAVKEFVVERGIPHLSKLFLAGFSEGGYITLATQKQLQKENNTGLEVTAVAAGAGGFDLFSMLVALSMGLAVHIQPAYIVYLILSYETVYGWNKPLDYYFSPAHAARIPELFSGRHDRTYINDRLGNNLGQVFNHLFYTNLKGNGEMELKKALISNSLSEWKPIAPLRLYHGLSDEVIPYLNTEFTYMKFIEHGAKKVEFIKLPGATHSSSLVPMLESVVPWFAKMAFTV